MFSHCYVYSFLLMFSGIDSEDSSLMSEHSKNRDRRVWTDEEADALLNILEDIVING